MKNNTDNCILEALESAERALTGYVGDITIDKRLSWVYGILVGWDDESLKEYAERHNISEREIIRLKEYRHRYTYLKRNIDSPERLTDLKVTKVIR